MFGRHKSLSPTRWRQPAVRDISLRYLYHAKPRIAGPRGGDATELAGSFVPATSADPVRRQHPPQPNRRPLRAVRRCAAACGLDSAPRKSTGWRQTASVGCVLAGTTSRLAAHATVREITHPTILTRPTNRCRVCACTHHSLIRRWHDMGNPHPAPARNTKGRRKRPHRFFCLRRPVRPPLPSRPKGSSSWQRRKRLVKLHGS